MNPTPTAEAGHVLRLTRHLAAPRELVFAAWSRPEHQRHWMGPTGFTVSTCEIDFRIGGRYRTRVHSPDGVEHCMYGEYREIVAPARLVFTFAWEAEGERGLENLVTIELVEQEDGTLMHFQQAPFRTATARDDHLGGWSRCFERLAAYLGHAA